MIETRACGAASRRDLLGDTTDPGTPPAHGLYDPALDKDIPAASASSPTSRAASRTRSSRTACASSAISSTAARSAPTRAWATAPASWCRSRTSSSPRKAAELGFTLPEPGEYAVGQLFMPRDANWRQIIRDIYADADRARGHAAARLARRADRQFDAGRVGQADRAGASAGVHRPRQEEIVARTSSSAGSTSCARSISNAIYKRRERRTAGYYPVSMSCRTVIYKGMFLADQLGTYYPDLHDPDFESALALVHQRFSTNTFPTWSLAHPYRYDRAQRRDQHAARQRQLDGGAAGDRVLAAVRQRHQQAVADLLRGPVRHRLLRQRARIPGAGRLLARPRHDDDDSRKPGRAIR